MAGQRGLGRQHLFYLHLELASSGPLAVWSQNPGLLPVGGPQWLCCPVCKFSSCPSCTSWWTPDVARWDSGRSASVDSSANSLLQGHVGRCELVLCHLVTGVCWRTSQSIVFKSAMPSFSDSWRLGTKPGDLLAIKAARVCPASTWCRQ